MENKKIYMFLTYEGDTSLPGRDSIVYGVENAQLIGFSQGENPEEALKVLIKLFPYIVDETDVEELSCREVVSETATWFNLNDYRDNKEDE